MKIIHISYGGPDRQIRDATGKVWRFEMHPHFGPAAQDTKGELLDMAYACMQRLQQRGGPARLAA